MDDQTEAPANFFATVFEVSCHDRAEHERIKQKIQDLLTDCEELIDGGIPTIFVVWFKANAQVTSTSGKYLGKVRIHFEDKVTEIVQHCAVHSTTAATPLEILDSSTRMAALIRAIGFPVVRD